MSKEFVAPQDQIGRFEVRAGCDGLGGRYEAPEGSLQMRTDNEAHARAFVNNGGSALYVLDTEDGSEYHRTEGWVTAERLGKSA